MPFWMPLGLLLIPYFSLVEGWAGLKGFVEHLKDRIGSNESELFEVISKTHVTTDAGGTRAA